MRVRTIYHRSAMAVRTSSSVAEAASMMNAGSFGALAVFEGDSLAGVISERDVVRAVASGADLATALVGEHMTRDPIVAGPDEDSSQAAVRMVQYGVRHLPVVEAGLLLGMISARDVLSLEAWPRVKGAERGGVA